jgi:hypothetical protein
MTDTDKQVADEAHGRQNPLVDDENAGVIVAPGDPLPAAVGYVGEHAEQGRRRGELRRGRRRRQGRRGGSPRDGRAGGRGHPEGDRRARRREPAAVGRERERVRLLRRQPGDDLTGTNAIVASASRTTSSNTGALDATAIRVLSLLLDVTAASGTTPTLDVVVEESDDGGTTWRTVGSFAQKTGVAQERKSFLIAADTYRVRWTLGGTTPNFTFSVSGSSKTG